MYVNYIVELSLIDYRFFILLIIVFSVKVKLRGLHLAKYLYDMIMLEVIARRTIYLVSSGVGISLFS